MTLIRSSRPSPVRRPASAASQRPHVEEAVRALRPEIPLHCLRPAVVEATGRRFVDLFPGAVLYAVKCNPDTTMLRALWAGGVRHFDVASIGEVRLIRGLFPQAILHFMHPIKSRAAIREAYQAHGVRDFVLDSVEELDKILAETQREDGQDRDLGLVVRLAPAKGKALWDLSGKFGADRALAARLLRLAAQAARRVGLSFHVGSQCMDPNAYRLAIALAGEIRAEAGVELDILDIGGGFPVAYPDLTPPPLEDFMGAITEGVTALALPAKTQLWCEPGRALVAAGASVVVQVQALRNGFLYINDGVYGSLSDAGAPALRFPVRLIRDDSRRASSGAPLVPFKFYGPTCDSVDRMEGPFLLPADIAEGDWIEIGQLGAYGACLRSGFNGFDDVERIEVSDPPLLLTPGHAPSLAFYSRAPLRRVA